jgi:hypothetical protein
LFDFFLASHFSVSFGHILFEIPDASASNTGVVGGHFMITFGQLKGEREGK